MLQHLREFFGFKSFHLHLIPDGLTGDLSEEPNEYASAMLTFLYIAERDG
jgi:hypothetical protein